MLTGKTIAAATANVNSKNKRYESPEEGAISQSEGDCGSNSTNVCQSNTSAQAAPARKIIILDRKRLGGGGGASNHGQQYPVADNSVNTNGGVIVPTNHEGRTLD